MGCVFCAIAADEAPAYRVAEDAHALAFLDINPLGPGHTLVVPRRHVSDLLAGGASTLQNLSPLVDHVARLLTDRLDADGVNLFHATGAAAGQEVFHLHLHVLPRWDGDGALNGLVGTSARSDDLASVHRRLGGAPSVRDATTQDGPPKR